MTKQFQFTTDYIADMNMDALDLEYYTVVYSVFSTNTMYAFGGDVTGSTYSMIGTVKQINGNASSGTGGYMPDVAMTRLNNPPPAMSTTGIKDYFTYISPDKDECRVSYLGFDELMTSSSPIALTNEHLVQPMAFAFVTSNPCTVSAVPPNTLAVSPFPRYYYSHGPKIDAPDYSDDSWSVITEQEEFYPTLNSVSGGTCSWPINTNKTVQLQVSAAYKVNGGAIQDIVLNDGSILGTIDMSKNLGYPFDNTLRTSQPAVAFSSANPNLEHWINFGWGKTQENGAINPNDYMGMAYDPASNLPFYAPGGAPYRIIDRNPAVSPYISVAFSGQNITTTDLYTVFIADTPNTAGLGECLYQKHPRWTDILNLGYKSTGINNTQHIPLQIQVQPNPFGDNFTLSVCEAHQNDIFEVSLTDILGKSIIHAKGSVADINQSIQNDLNHQKTLSSGFYFPRVHSEAAQKKVIFKLIKK